MILGCAYAAHTHLRPSELSEADSYISYLPAAHSFEQVMFGITLNTGVSMGFFSGDVLKLMEDI